MKRTIALLVALAVNLGAAAPAHAMLASLVSCSLQPNGQYLGVYSLMGQQYTFFFRQYCPPSVNI